MATILLGDPAYVHERYSEIEAERRRQHTSYPSPPRSSKSAEETSEYSTRSGVESDQSADLALAPNTTWAASEAEKALAVMDDVLRELMAQTQLALEAKTLKAAGADVDSADDSVESTLPATLVVAKKQHSSGSAAPPTALIELPASSQFGLEMFFRLSASLRASVSAGGTSRLLSLVAPTIPSMLDKLPRACLSPGVITHERLTEEQIRMPSSVFEELLGIFGELLAPSLKARAHTDQASVLPPHLSEEDRANVLVAYIALSLKWGRLRDIVQALRFLVENPNALAPLRIKSLHRALHELTQAEPEPPNQPIIPEEAAITGFLVSFGKGDHGKLGHGQCSHATCTDGNCTENKDVPTVIGATRDVKFAKIDSLSTHSIAITTKGEVMAWGNGDKYRLGHGTTTKEYAPRVIDSLSLKGKVQDVACGLGHTLALMSHGEIFAWGNGSNGRLGLGDSNDRSNPTKLSFLDETRSAAVPGSQPRPANPPTFRHVMCGASHSLALTLDGRVFAWGKNNQGQCGHGHTNDQLTAIEIRHFLDELSERIVHVAGGWEHTLFCSASGRLYSCGCGYKDSRRTGIPPVLGHGDCEKRLKPTVIQCFVDANEEMARVSCGWDHSLAVSAQGALYTWGSGTNGKLGHGDEENCEVPTLVRSLLGKFIKDARAGCEHTVALTDNYELYTFGQGDSGRLGLGDTLTRKLPTLVDFFTHSGLRPVAIAVGDKYNLILADKVVTTDHPVPQSPPRTKSPSNAKRNASNSYSDQQSSRRSRRSNTLTRPSTDAFKLNDLDSCFAAEGSVSSQLLNIPDFEFSITDQKTLTSFIARHITRLASGYLPWLDKLSGVAQSITLLPYGIDTSATSLERIVELIRICCDQDDGSGVSFDRTHVALACLRLLTVNVGHGGDIQDAATVSNVALYRNICEIVTSLACTDTTFSFAGMTDDVQIGNFMREEAVQILRVGFARFYPTTTDRLGLLWELSESASIPHKSPAIEALGQRLCEDSTIHDIVLECVQKTASHECILPDLNEPNKLIDKSTDGLSVNLRSLLQYMAKLVRGWTAPETKKGSDTLSTQPCGQAGVQLQVLSVLQGHLFAVAGCSLLARKGGSIGTPESELDHKTIGICECCIKGLAMYLELLFEEALVAITTLHSTMIETKRSTADTTASRAYPYFLQLVVTQATHAAAAILTTDTIRLDQSSSGATMSRERIKLVRTLLPSVKSMLHLLDEMACKISPDGAHGDLRCSSDLSKNRMAQLGEACSLLYGQLSNCFIRAGLVGDHVDQNDQTDSCDDGAVVSSVPEVGDLRAQSLQDGLMIINDAFAQLRCANMKTIFVIKISEAFPRLSKIPDPRDFARVLAANAQILDDFCGQLIQVLAAKGLSTQTRIASLSMWLWVLNCGLLDSIELNRAVVETGIVRMVGSILLSSPAMASNEDSERLSSDRYLQNAKRGLHSSLHLRPVEELVGAGRPNQVLYEVAHEVFTAAAKLRCSVSRLADADIHPIFHTCEIDVEAFAVGSSSRGNITGTSVDQTVKLAFAILSACLQKAASAMEKWPTRLSPLATTKIGQQSDSIIQPSHAFLLASPLSVSEARSHVLKPLRLPRSKTSLEMTAPQKIAAMSIWFYVETFSPGNLDLSPSTNAVVVLAAIGDISMRNYESGAAGTTNSPMELNGSDNVRLALFLVYERNELRVGFGYADDVHESSAWTAFGVETPIHSGHWINIAVSLPSSVQSPEVFVNGRHASCHKLAGAATYPTQLKHPDEPLFGNMSSRTQIIIGGAVADSKRTSLGLPKTGEAIDSGEAGSFSQAAAESCPSHLVLDVVIDDIWVYADALSEPLAASLFDNGMTIAQAKRDAEVESRVLKTLGLLHQLLDLVPVVKAAGGTGIAEDKSALLVVLLQLLRCCRHQASFTIALRSVAVLKQIMPPLLFDAKTSQEILKSLKDYLLPASTESASYDLRTELTRFHAFSSSPGTQAAPVSASLSAVLGILDRDKILKAPASNGQSVKSIAGHDVMLQASIIQLFQSLAASPPWQPPLRRLFDDATIQMSGSLQSSGGTNGSEATTLATVKIAAGYSETFVNELRVRLGRQAIGAEAFLCDAPWTSTRFGVTEKKTWHSVCGRLGLDLEKEIYVLTASKTENGLAVGQLKEDDEQVMTRVRLQCAVLRHLLGQLHSSATTENATRFLSDPTVVAMLTTMAAKRAGDLVNARLGESRKAALRLRSVRLSRSALAQPSSTSRLFVEEELEPLAWDLLSTLGSQRRRLEFNEIGFFHPFPFWRSPKPQPSPLELLSGEAEIQGLTLRSSQHFPTVRLGRVSITAQSGLWYYEVRVLSDGLMQIGYIDSDFVPDAVQGQGVGDHANSWAFDGFRRKKWNVSSADYGEAWKAADVVGVLLDTDRMELSYFLNGAFLGVAFSNMPFTPATLLSPAVSLNADQIVTFDFGLKTTAESTNLAGSKSHFKLPELHSPLDRQRLRPVIDAMDDIVAGVGLDMGKLHDEVEQSGFESLAGESDEDDGDFDQGSLQTLTTPPCGASHGIYRRTLADIDGSFLASPSLPGSLRDIQDESLFASSLVETIQPSLQTARRDSNRDGSEDGDHDDERGNSKAVQKEELVTSLVALGFPHELAARCAVETSFTVNDTAAVSWILEQMEKQATSSGNADTSPVVVDGGAGLERTTHSAVSVLARDDLPIRTSSGRLAGAGRRSWQLSLAEGRPHSDQVTRNRAVTPSSLTEQITSDAPLAPQLRSIDVNPFFVAELVEAFDDHDEEEPSILGTSEGARLKSTGVQSGESLRRQFAEFTQRAGKGTDAATTTIKNDSGGPQPQLMQDIEDLLPACVVVHSILSLAYVRLIAETVLFDPMSDLTQVYPAVVQWATKEPRGLFGFLRSQFRFDAKQIPISFSRTSVPGQERRLLIAFTRLLNFEIEDVNLTEASQLPLQFAVAAEVRAQIASGLRTVKQSKSSKNQPSRALAIALRAQWTRWLVGSVKASLASGRLDGMPPILKTHWLEDSFSGDVVKVAAGAKGICAPWKTAALSTLALLLSIQSKSAEPQLGHELGMGMAVSIRFLVELLAQLLQRDRSRRLAFADPVPTLWEIVLAHVPSPSKPNVLEVAMTQNEIALSVEQIASTHATISWEHRDQKQQSANGDSVDKAPDPSIGMKHVVLSLEMIPIVSHLPQSESSDSLTKMSGIPHLLPSKGSLVLRHLAPDTCYNVRITKTSTQILSDSNSNEDHDTTPQASVVVQQTQIRTPPEPVFELDADAAGKNLVLCNRNRTVKNQVNKKWHTIRASVGFQEGLHHWHVRIDSCVSKNIFIGICTADASLENYVGSDAHGYGFLANKAVWHNKSKIQPYGEIFKQGDLLQVSLDCNARSLSYSRNGEFLGIAATNLHAASDGGGGGGRAGGGHGSASCKWYPAFSLYNKDDQLTLIVPQLSSPGMDRPPSQHVSVLELVGSARLIAAAAASAASQSAAQPSRHHNIHALWFKWRSGSVVWREIAMGQVVRLDATRDYVTKLFGFAPGDSIFTHQGQCVVVGVYNHELWYEVVDSFDSSSSGSRVASLDSWSLSTCREMTSLPDEYPVHRTRRHEDIDEQKLSESQSSREPTADSPVAREEAVLVDTQARLGATTSLDLALMRFVDALVLHRGVCSPHHLSFADVSSAILLHDAVDALSPLVSSVSQQPRDALLMRLAFLFDLNQHAYRVARLFLRQDPSVYQLDLSNPLELSTRQVPPSTPSPGAGSHPHVWRFVRERLFETQRERLIAEALRRSATPTHFASPSADSNSAELSNEPPVGESNATIRLKIRTPTTSPVPFWQQQQPTAIQCQTKPSWWRVASSYSERYKTTLFTQVSSQLAGVNPSQWRRRVTTLTDAFPVTRTFQLAFVVPSAISPVDTAASVTDGAVVVADHTSQYLTFYDDLFTEIQSPRFPLFVPSSTSPPALDVNAHLLLAECAVTCDFTTSEALVWFHHLGMVLGMVWRASTIVPLRHVSLQFWADLLDENQAASESMDRFATARAAAIKAVRDGLCCVVPYEVLQLSTPQSIRFHLTDVCTLPLERMQRHAIDEPASAHHIMFWEVVRTFSAYELRALLEFLTGKSSSHLTSDDDCVGDAIDAWKRCVLTMATAADSESEPPRAANPAEPARPFRLELVEPLADAFDHPDACFPVVHVVDARHARLHLPAYSSSSALRQKLLVSMSSLSSL